jgi:hypothetical protein
MIYNFFNTIKLNKYYTYIFNWFEEQSRIIYPDHKMYQKYLRCILKNNSFNRYNDST